MVHPVLGSSSGGVVAGNVNKLLFDVLYQLEKDAGKVLIVTAFSALAPSFSRLPIKSSTVVLGALALAATLLGTQLVGHASIENGLDRGGAASLLLAVALLVVALVEHLRPRAPAASVQEAAAPPSWRPVLGPVALPAGAVAACGVPAVVLASRRASSRRRRREETQRLLEKQGEALQRALALLNGIQARLPGASEEDEDLVKKSTP
jgi:hypothetical protein